MENSCNLNINIFNIFCYNVYMLFDINIMVLIYTYKV